MTEKTYAEWDDECVLGDPLEQKKKHSLTETVDKTMFWSTIIIVLTGIIGIIIILWLEGLL